MGHAIGSAGNSGDRLLSPRGSPGLDDRFRRPSPTPITPVVLQDSELTRLAEMVRATYETTQPARAFRIGAASAAYDRKLLEATRRLGLAGPDGRPPLSAQARFDTEAKLLAAGLRR